MFCVGAILVCSVHRGLNKEAFPSVLDSTDVHMQPPTVLSPLMSRCPFGTENYRITRNACCICPFYTKEFNNSTKKMWILVSF